MSLPVSVLEKFHCTELCDADGRVSGITKYGSIY